MNIEEAKNVIFNARQSTEEIEKLDKRINSIKSYGVMISTTNSIGITNHLDDKTKTVIANIVLPELEAKREELTEYLQTLLTGGIINDESK